MTSLTNEVRPWSSRSSRAAAASLASHPRCGAPSSEYSSRHRHNRIHRRRRVDKGSPHLLHHLHRRCLHHLHRRCLLRRPRPTSPRTPHSLLLRRQSRRPGAQMGHEVDGRAVVTVEPLVVALVVLEEEVIGS